MNKKRVLILASVASMIEQFNIINIEILQSLGYEVYVACNFINGSNLSKERTEQFKSELIEKNVKYYQIDFARNPFCLLENLRAFRRVTTIFRTVKFDLLHCHAPVSSAIGRLVAKCFNVKAIYTAHGFHFYKGASLLSWLLYLPLEWLLSFFTDCLITINQEDYAFAKKYLHPKKVEYIPGVGIDLDKFKYPRRSRTVMRKELQIPEKATVLLSVGELNKNKNHETALKAFAKINDNSLFYVICGHGPLAEHLRNLVHRLKVSDRVLFLGYRSDIVDIMKASDIYIHPSFREGLPVSLMEAMACGLPCLASKIRGNTDLIKGLGKNYLFAPNDVDALSKAITGLASSDEEQNLLKEENIKQIKSFDNATIIAFLHSFYNFTELNGSNND